MDSRVLLALGLWFSGGRNCHFRSGCLGVVLGRRILDTVADDLFSQAQVLHEFRWMFVSVECG